MQFANYKGLWQRLANNKSSTVKRIFLTATSFFSCFSFSFRFASTVQRYCGKGLLIGSNCQCYSLKPEGPYHIWKFEAIFQTMEY